MELKNKKYSLIDTVALCFKINHLAFWGIFLLSIIGALIPSALVVMNAVFIDAALTYVKERSNFNEVMISIAKISLTLIILYFHTIGIQLLYDRLDVGFKSKLYDKFIERSVRLKYEYIENGENCNLINRVLNKPGLATIHQSLTHIAGGLSVVVYLLGLTITIWKNSWWLVPFLVVVSIPLIISTNLMSKEVYNSVRWNSELARKSNYVEFDMLRGRDLAPERCLFGYTKYFNKQFEKYFMKAVNLENKIRRKWLIINLILTAVIIASCVFVPLILLTQLESGAMTLGLFISVVTAIFQLEVVLTTRIPSLISFLSEDKEYMVDVTKFMELEEESVNHNKLVKHRVIETLEFKDVYFKYPGTTKMILKGISFKLEKGVHYAIVGKNGSGKSTLTKLMLGLYEIDKGEIIINGKNIKEYAKQEVYEFFSLIYQDYAQYAIPVKDNIGIGNIKEMYNQEKINKAASLAGIGEDIDKLPKGMETPLGKVLEEGVDISGGQWQRIALARSLMRDNTVRILDEPTSALDPLEESKLYGKYKQISKKDTTIFISHRLGSTKLADKIYVIDDGNLVEVGNHNELMKKNGLYSEMFNTQKEWYDAI
jgi:ATP-binding cassette, subfamily B, bacterial